MKVDDFCVVGKSLNGRCKKKKNYNNIFLSKELKNLRLFKNLYYLMVVGVCKKYCRFL